jgi:hypothetical protein
MERNSTPRDLPAATSSHALALASLPMKQRARRRQRPRWAKAWSTRQSGPIGVKPTVPTGSALMSSLSWRREASLARPFTREVPNHRRPTSGPNERLARRFRVVRVGFDANGRSVDPRRASPRNEQLISVPVCIDPPLLEHCADGQRLTKQLLYR